MIFWCTCVKVISSTILKDINIKLHVRWCFFEIDFSCTVKPHITGTSLKRTLYYYGHFISVPIESIYYVILCTAVSLMQAPRYSVLRTPIQCSPKYTKHYVHVLKKYFLIAGVSIWVSTSYRSINEGASGYIQIW